MGSLDDFDKEVVGLVDEVDEVGVALVDGVVGELLVEGQFGQLGQFLLRVGDPLLDRRFALSSSPAQPRLQGLDRRRHDEQVLPVLMLRMHLHCALDVDVQQADLPPTTLTLPLAMMDFTWVSLVP